jgi:hypothetical protein
MKTSRKAPSGATVRVRTPAGRTVAKPAPVEDHAPPVAPAASTSAVEPSFLFTMPDGPDVWQIAARTSLLDLLATAREGARRPRRRVLSRAEIRRQAREAFAGASALIDEAAQALRTASRAR